MVIVVRLDPSRLWRWHLALIALLKTDPTVSVSVEFVDDHQPLPTLVDLAVRWTAPMANRSIDTGVSQVSRVELAPWIGATSSAPDIVIDLATHDIPCEQTGRVLVPLYNGTPGEVAFWSTVMMGQAPRLAIYDTTGGSLSIGQPAIENPHALVSSASGVIACLITGLAHAVTPSDTAIAGLPEPMAPTPPLAKAAVSLLTRKVATKLERLGKKVLGTTPQWAVAWRNMPSSYDSLSSGHLQASDFTLLPDDGARYYADPFLFSHGDDVHLFVEELPYATNRGIISVATRRTDGSFPTPSPVLQTQFHLSYPHVFERDGAIWMLPEQSASGGLTLYRATHFPNDWEAVAQLIDEPLHDATLFEHGGQLWIAANTQGPSTSRWGSSWDSLSLYSAPTLLGPWTAHRGNPVLINAATTRSAGAIVNVDGKLYRPVQDCSTGYGTALGLAELNTLTPSAFGQTIVGRLNFDRKSGLVGPHTLNRLHLAAAQIEVIDLFASKQTLASAGFT